MASVGLPTTRRIRNITSNIATNQRTRDPKRTFFGFASGFRKVANYQGNGLHQSFVNETIGLRRSYPVPMEYVRIDIENGHAQQDQRPHGSRNENRIALPRYRNVVYDASGGGCRQCSIGRFHVFFT